MWKLGLGGFMVTIVYEVLNVVMAEAETTVGNMTSILVVSTMLVRVMVLAIWWSGCRNIQGLELALTT